MEKNREPVFTNWFTILKGEKQIL